MIDFFGALSILILVQGAILVFILCRQDGRARNAQVKREKSLVEPIDQHVAKKEFEELLAESIID